MTPSEKAAVAKLNANVTEAASLLLANIKSESKKRGGEEGEELVAIVIAADLLTDLRIAVKASEALLAVIAEGDGS